MQPKNSKHENLFWKNRQKYNNNKIKIPVFACQEVAVCWWKINGNLYMELSRYKNDVYLSRVGRILFSIFLTIFFSYSVANNDDVSRSGLWWLFKSSSRRWKFCSVVGLKNLDGRQYCRDNWQVIIIKLLKTCTLKWLLSSY